ncbi:hypothetical protein ACXU4B_14555 [Dyella soli]|uniref:Uncharacterized protein n=1 Tax=Dyella soli TaxID=522319 RepID=A0A4R0YT35_9GAMM|nr:hypothetical protein [Dyella soli]TCI09132.1 hypothetical protein EZM97_23120 [Dyella soli]
MTSDVTTSRGSPVKGLHRELVNPSTSRVASNPSRDCRGNECASLSIDRSAVMVNDGHLFGTTDRVDHTALVPGLAGTPRSLLDDGVDRRFATFLPVYRESSGITLIKG